MILWKSVMLLAILFPQCDGSIIKRNHIPSYENPMRCHTFREYVSRGLYILYIDYSIDFTLQFIQPDSLHHTSV